MPKIVFLDRDTIGPVVTLSRPDFVHQWVEYDRTREAEVADRIRDADIVIANKAQIVGHIDNFQKGRPTNVL